MVHGTTEQNGWPQGAAVPGMLGRHFALDELTHSQAAVRLGLSNEPDAAALEWIGLLVRTVLDPIREAVGRPVLVSSGYRSPSVNAAIGGARKSQHMLGQAADIRVNGITPAELTSFIRTLSLPFDQLIEEPTWVHVSVGPLNRQQVLRATRTSAGMTYEVIP